MIALAFALVAAGPASAVDAERAFAATAQTQGQWNGRTYDTVIDDRIDAER